MSLRFAINSPSFAEPTDLVELAVLAERAGWDAFFLWDHMVVDPNGVPIVDPWVVLGAIAVRTERLRLGTCVTPLARRRPQKVARETTTLDRLSDGRMILGVGLGVPEVDHTTFGEPADLPTLAARLDEALVVLDGLWSGERFSFAGRHFQVDAVSFLPTPVQRPRPPVWSACTWPHRGGVRRAARLDGIIPLSADSDDMVFLTPDEIAVIVAEVRDLRGTLDGFDVAINPGEPPYSLADFEAAGATWCMQSMGGFPGWLDELTEIVRAGPPR